MAKLDQFYTKPEVAELCYQQIKQYEKYYCFIEPSAGDGSFSKLNPECFAYDIEPKHQSIEQLDFLKFSADLILRDVIYFGNPPFGTRNDMIKKFVNHCLKNKATIIAFILPDTFNKLTNQSIFPKDWKLISITKLPKNSFIAENKEIDIPCSFFIWSKEGDINLRKEKLKPIKDFQFLSRGSENADFCVNGNNGKVKDLSQVTNSKAEHYIKGDREIFEKELPKYYEFYSSVNGKVAWIGQQEILEAYQKFLEKKECE